MGLYGVYIGVIEVYIGFMLGLYGAYIGVIEVYIGFILGLYGFAIGPGIQGSGPE